MSHVTSRRPTIVDVAARAGVSKSLASRALRGDGRVSQESEAAIRIAAQELNYRPNVAARNLVETRSKTLGIVVLDVHNPMLAELLDTVQSEVFDRGWNTMLVTGQRDRAIEHSEVTRLIDFRVEGLVLIGHRLPEGLDHLSARCPAVVLGSTHRGHRFVNSVCNDDQVGARLAVEHLLELGHRDIVHITGGDNPVSRERESAYVQTMSAHRLKGRTRSINGGFDNQAGYDAALTVLRRSRRPTALFVANDYAAIGALAAAMELGIEVPRELSVVGYDGVAIAALRPFNLTTVAQPISAMGRQAVDLLITDDGHRSTAAHLLLPPRLLKRGSTGPPSR